MPPVPTRRLPATPVVKPEWVERHLVFRFPSGRVHAQLASWYGTLAVHPALPSEVDSSLYIVTHTPTRLAIVKVATIEDAVTIAEYLWDNYRLAFYQIDDVDKTKLPPNVVEWIGRCNKEKRCWTFPTGG